jgi:hypothetical protein
VAARVPPTPSLSMRKDTRFICPIPFILISIPPLCVGSAIVEFSLGLLRREHKSGYNRVYQPPRRSLLGPLSDFASTLYPRFPPNKRCSRPRAASRRATVPSPS